MAAVRAWIIERERKFFRAVRKERVTVEKVEHETKASVRWNGYRCLDCGTNLNERRLIELQLTKSVAAHRMVEESQDS